MALTDEELQQYMYELTLQQRASAIAGSRLDATLKRVRAHDPENLNSYVFADLQSLLGTGAMFSKLLWPMDPLQMKGDAQGNQARKAFTRARGEQVRSALRITDIPILHSRAVRNGFEHFDTDLDQVLRTRTNEALVDFSLLGTSPAKIFIRTPGGPEVVLLRTFRFDVEKASVLDTEVDIVALRRAMNFVGKKAQRWLDDRKSTLP